MLRAWKHDGYIGLRLRRRYNDGTTHIALTHFERAERLCSLVPRPGTHRVRYQRMFAAA